MYSLIQNQCELSAQPNRQNSELWMVKQQQMKAWSVGKTAAAIN